MQQNFQNPVPQPQPLDPRNQPQRLRSMSAVMLTFAIIHSVNLISFYITPWLTIILSLATIVLAIVLMTMAPKGYKAGLASGFGLAADLLFGLALLFLLFAGIDIINANPGLATSASEDVNLTSSAVGLSFFFSASIFISWAIRIAGVVFGYISFVELKKGADQNRMNGMMM